MRPRIQRVVAEHKRISADIQHAIRYRAAATPVISQLAVQIDRDPDLKKAIPTDLQNKIYNIVNQENE